MNIERLPSGSYRARIMIKGKSYKATFDHKPSEAEVMLAISKKVETIIVDAHIPFKVGANEYCKMKKNVISPATYREYTNTPNRLSESFRNLYIDEISQIDIQYEINNLSVKRSAKTVKNYHAFIASVINMYRPNFAIHTTLPKGVKKEKYIPTDEEAKTIMERAKTDSDGMFYVPFVLACYGMRRSEICALQPSDFKGGYAYINKGMVLNVDNEWVIKNYPKTEQSTRSIPIPSDVIAIIKEQGYVYKGHPNSISRFIERICKQCGFEHLTIHNLRHYFCSRLSAENVDVETILALGGWETDYVMKTNYRHKVKDKVKEASTKLDKILFS